MRCWNIFLGWSERQPLILPLSKLSRNMYMDAYSIYWYLIGFIYQDIASSEYVYYSETMLYILYLSRFLCSLVCLSCHTRE